MTGSAGTAHLACMLYVNTIAKRGATDCLTWLDIYCKAFWANFLMG
jgi:hypothetical protein